jgi:hypothetical protein
MKDIELGGRGLLLLALLILALAAAVNCAGVPQRPHLWDLCRVKCAEAGANVAAVIGPVDEEKPACLCQKRPIEPRGGI